MIIACLMNFVLRHCKTNMNCFTCHSFTIHSFTDFRYWLSFIVWYVHRLYLLCKIKLEFTRSNYVCEAISSPVAHSKLAALVVIYYKWPALCSLECIHLRERLGLN